MKPTSRTRALPQLDVDPLPAYRHGWYLVAFQAELAEGLNAAAIGARRLVLLRAGDSVRAFDADCPHRGANLALGGRLRDHAIECPFHGHLVCIEHGRKARFQATEYEVLRAGDLVFVRLSDEHDNGLAARMRELLADSSLVPVIDLRVRAPMELVIENAFDRLHFHAVHRIRTERFDVRRAAAGALVVTSRFHVPRVVTGARGKRTIETAPVPYRADVVSPGIAIVHLGGPSPYGAITGAIAEPGGLTRVRLAFLLPAATFGPAPRPAAYQQLLDHSRRGLEQDQQIWENLARTRPPSFTKDDGPIEDFARFCRGFA